jgi:hypothetical protein
MKFKDEISGLAYGNEEKIKDYIKDGKVIDKFLEDFQEALTENSQEFAIEALYRILKNCTSNKPAISNEDAPKNTKDVLLECVKRIIQKYPDILFYVPSEVSGCELLDSYIVPAIKYRYDSEVLKSYPIITIMQFDFTLSILNNYLSYIENELPDGKTVDEDNVLHLLFATHTNREKTEEHKKLTERILLLAEKGKVSFKSSIAEEELLKELNENNYSNADNNKEKFQKLFDSLPKQKRWSLFVKPEKVLDKPNAEIKVKRIASAMSNAFSFVIETLDDPLTINYLKDVHKRIVTNDDPDVEPREISQLHCSIRYTNSSNDY